MEKKTDSIRPVLIYLKPTKEELAKLYSHDRREDIKDRRKLHTYIADDRRNGPADRRKTMK
jgi:hypothetical protein